MERRLTVTTPKKEFVTTFHKRREQTRGFEKVIVPIYPNHEVVLPKRSDKGSAGYDFYTPVDLTIEPGETAFFWTDVKAYMQEDEYLQLHVRSSLGIKQGLILANGTGIIDSSYYNNSKNEGNIGCKLLNTSKHTQHIKAGDRVMQGLFQKYLVADGDVQQATVRRGGFGSSGK